MELTEPHSVSRAEIRDNQLTVCCFCGFKECLRIKRRTYTVTNISLLKKNIHMYQTCPEHLKLQKKKEKTLETSGEKNLTYCFSFLSTVQSEVVITRGGGSLQVRTPAQIHLTEQFVICGFLD